MKVFIIKTYPNFAEQKMYLQWEVENPPVGDITFTVFRSEAPNDGFEQISKSIYNSYFFIDTFEGTPGFFSLDRPIYYKVKATCGDESVESEPVYYDGCISANPKEQRDIDASYRHFNNKQYDKQLRLLRNKLISDFSIALKKLYGVSAVLLKRKHWGHRCGNCFDPIANKQIKSHCQICYDTTWIGGYIPIEILVHEQRPMPIQIGKDIPGKVEVKQTAFTTLYFPKINSGDVLIIKYNNTRYYVKSTNETYIRTIPIHQTVVVDLLAPEHIIYSFPIDTQEGAYVV
ncbi:MAG: hypothetical protein ABIM30_00630 [candidate division WOR-3 bacterium]